MRKVYMSIGRIVATVGYPLFIVYFRFYPSRRVRILVFNQNKQILLVRNWLGFQKWTLPGGGCRKYETNIVAASRELFEETGLRIAPEEFTLLKETKDPELNYKAPLLAAEISHHSLEPLKGQVAWEIIERNWWEKDKLPGRRSPLVDIALESLRLGVK